VEFDAHTIVKERDPSVSLAQKAAISTIARHVLRENTLDRARRGGVSIDQLMKPPMGIKVARTAPPTSYNNQFMVWPPTFISNECSVTPSVCILTFRISSMGADVSGDQGSK